MHVVLSIGGSLLNPGTPDVRYIRELAKILRESKFSFGVSTGGGKIARDYAKAILEVGGTEYDADEAGIMSTRQNARLLIAAIGKDALRRQRPREARA